MTDRSLDKILIIDDDLLQAEMISTLLSRKLSLPSVQAACGKEALSILRHDTYNTIKLVLLDLGLPDMHGQDILAHITQRYGQTLPVIIITGSGHVHDAVKALKTGAYDYMTKPCEGERIITTVKNALKTSLLTQEVRRLQTAGSHSFGFDNLIGAAGGLKQSVALGEKAASVDLPVLITGETGTGKDVFARAIHGQSTRAERPFIAINCGAIPAQLVESTLFGHEKGSFTGATQASLGKFREADGGTIFLDEVGELPLDTQVKLLRILQQKEVEPVGAGKSYPVDIRIISATNRNLKEAVKTGAFREDLFYRLNVLTIELPPLRTRMDDLADFCAYFIDLFCQQHGLPHHRMDDKAFSLLQAHSWPGNVRELENTLGRAITLCDHEFIKASDIQLNHVNTLIPDADKAPTMRQTHTKGATSFAADLHARHSFLAEDGLIKPLAQIEREAMHLALELCDGNTTQAAKMLGMAKSTFYRKTKEHSQI